VQFSFLPDLFITICGLLRIQDSLIKGERFMLMKANSTLANFQGTAIRDMHMAFKIPYHTMPNYAGNKQKSFQIMKIHIFEVLHQVKPRQEI
jgi:hypothetical protein